LYDSTMKSLITIIVVFSILQACESKPTNLTANDSMLNESEREFEQIVNGIPVLELPHRFAYWLNKIPPITDSVTLKWCEQFWNTNSKNVWGRVFVDQPNIHLLATQPDDQGTAFLITFDRSGKLLTEEPLQRGDYVSADPQYATDNYSTLYPDMRLVEIDSLFRYPYDSINNDRLEGEEMCKVTNHEYKIEVNGSLKVIRYDTTGYFKTGY
jgi:hypothetical protein